MYISKRVLYKGLKRQKRKRVKQPHGKTDFLSLLAGIAGLSAIGGLVLFSAS